MAGIAFFEVNAWERAYLRKRLKHHTFYFFEKPIEAGDLEKIRDVEVLSVFIYSREALQRILDTTVENIECGLAGELKNKAKG